MSTGEEQETKNICATTHNSIERLIYIPEDTALYIPSPGIFY